MNSETDGRLEAARPWDWPAAPATLAGFWPRLQKLAQEIFCAKGTPYLVEAGTHSALHQVVQGLWRRLA
jgi:hypothetical protein